MYDNNYDLEIDSDFDMEDYATELDVYETEVDNKIWINELISGINLD